MCKDYKVDRSTMDILIPFSISNIYLKTIERYRYSDNLKYF